MKEQRAIMPDHLPAIVTDAFEELRGGSLGVRLARNAAEIDAAQALRYQVFYDEMGAHPSEQAARTHRDEDPYDAVADHLLVVDHLLGEGPGSIVGTYRLIRRAGAERIGSFYSAAEYDISKIIAFQGEVLELGRSCINASHRGMPAMQLMWRGIAAYVFLHKIDLMFGCASLHGTDPDTVGRDLTYLWANHLAPAEIRPRALPELYVDMRRMDPAQLDMRRALAALPPLIKGYLRLGGFVGDGAVIDHQFNTTDVAVVVKTDLITEKYRSHYAREQSE
jgi:L-ornithine Nalpha-acyltransferase